MTTSRAKYDTDLTDEQWQLIQKYLPAASRRGRAAYGLPSRNHQRDFVHQSDRCRLASAPARLSQVADVLHTVLAVAK